MDHARNKFFLFRWVGEIYRMFLDEVERYNQPYEGSWRILTGIFPSEFLASILTLACLILAFFVLWWVLYALVSIIFNI